MHQPQNVVYDPTLQRAFMYTTDMAPRKAHGEFLFLDCPNTAECFHLCISYFVENFGHRMVTLGDNDDMFFIEFGNEPLANETKHRLHVKTKFNFVVRTVQPDGKDENLFRMLVANFMPESYPSNQELLVVVPAMEQGSLADTLWNSVGSPLASIERFDTCCVDAWIKLAAKRDGRSCGKIPQ